MKYLLDTCVLSELVRPSPEPKVLEWLEARNEDDLYLSVLTLGEIRRGISKLADGEKKSNLLDWYIELADRFEGRTVAIDLDIAEEWGGVQRAIDRQGRPMPVIDAFLAVTAMVENFVLVTRNAPDFRPAGVEIIDPWNG